MACCFTLKVEIVQEIKIIDFFCLLSFFDTIIYMPRWWDRKLCFTRLSLKIIIFIFFLAYSLTSLPVGDGEELYFVLCMLPLFVVTSQVLWFESFFRFSLWGYPLLRLGRHNDAGGYVFNRDVLYSFQMLQDRYTSYQDHCFLFTCNLDQLFGVSLVSLI